MDKKVSIDIYQIINLVIAAVAMGISWRTAYLNKKNNKETKRIALDANARAKKERLLELHDSLDSKSGWRKELFNISSKHLISLDDVMRLRASVRYLKKSSTSIENQQNDIQYLKRIFTRDIIDFDDMSDAIIDFCEYIRKNYEKKVWKSKLESKRLEYTEAEVFRALCRWLLKNHWETLDNISFGDSFAAEQKRNKNRTGVAETVDYIKTLLVI